MNRVIEYIESLPLLPAAKWTVCMMAFSDKNLLTQSWLVQHSYMNKRGVRHQLYSLIESGVIARRRDGNQFFYFITDIRLKHYIAAEKNNFEPIKPTSPKAEC